MRDEATPCASSALAALMAPNRGAAPTAAATALHNATGSISTHVLRTYAGIEMPHRRARTLSKDRAMGLMSRVSGCQGC